MKVRMNVCLAAATAAVSFGLCVGCIGSGDPEDEARREAAKREIAEVVQLAYAAGGRDLVAARIDQLVTDGKITESQAAMLRAAAQAVYERTVDRLEGGTNAVLATDESSGGTDM